MLVGVFLKHMFSFMAVLCAASLFLGGCYSRTVVPARAMKHILSPGQSREIIFYGENREKIRLGPNSQIRFFLVHGPPTPWIEGRHLFISNVGAWEIVGREQKLVARWDEVAGAQVKNLSGGRTYLAVVGSVVVAGVVIAMIAGSGKGGNGLGGLGKGLAGGGRAVAKGAALLAEGVARGAVHTVFHMGLYIEPAVVEAATAEPGYIEEEVHHSPPGPPPPPPPQDENIQHPSEPLHYPEHYEPESGRIRVPYVPVSLFSERLKRRSFIRFVGDLEAGSDLIMHDGFVTNVFAGIRLKEIFEIAVGARLMVHRGSPEDGEEKSHRASWIAAARLALNFDIDSMRRIALPVGVEVGLGHELIDVRMLLGIRFRLNDIVQLGFYPFNPAYTRFKDETLKRKTGWWSFPTTVSVTFGF